MSHSEEDSLETPEFEFDQEAAAPAKKATKKAARKTAKKATKKTTKKVAKKATKKAAKKIVGKKEIMTSEVPVDTMVAPSVSIKPPVDEVPTSFSTDDDQGDSYSSDKDSGADTSFNDAGEEGKLTDYRGSDNEPSNDNYSDDRAESHNRPQQRFQKNKFGNSGGKFQKKNFSNKPQGKFAKKNTFNKKFNQQKNKGGFNKSGNKAGGKRVRAEQFGFEEGVPIEVGSLPEWSFFRNFDSMNEEAVESRAGGDEVNLNHLYTLPLMELVDFARDEFDINLETAPVRMDLIEEIMIAAYDECRAIVLEGILELSKDGYGLLVCEHDNYRIRPQSAFVAQSFIKKFGLKRGTILKVQLAPPREENEEEGSVGETTPYVIHLMEVMGKDPVENLSVIPFEDLIPYYPTERLMMETNPEVKWDNISMRVTDLLTPVGKGQRGLIVAPPRTGKTVLQQGIASAVMENNPEAHLMILLVDERPEEVTDFRRQIKKGEVIASTFDESPENHVHVAEMVIEKARRMVENGQHVIILLDSITRLARAYNALAANSGKILSGGVEANALQKPKRFFGSARNIEGGGSLTILGTALVETGSRMDEVIFEEFKGTGNMELHLDRELVNKRIFPAINLEKSGTRKEELLYHPDEMRKVYGLRRAMKGVPSTEAMEMLINRVKKTKTNIEFLMSLQH